MSQNIINSNNAAITTVRPWQSNASTLFENTFEVTILSQTIIIGSGSWVVLYRNNGIKSQ